MKSLISTFSIFYLIAANIIALIYWFFGYQFINFPSVFQLSLSYFYKWYKFKLIDPYNSPADRKFQNFYAKNKLRHAEGHGQKSRKKVVMT